MDRTRNTHAAQAGAPPALRQRATAGFTTVEVITVVGIVAILLGVVFVSIFTLRTSLLQFELDATAREIYIAAQNHLTAAQTQGLLENASLNAGAEYNAADDERYFIYSPDAADPIADGITSPDAKNAALNLMLPFASIDETVRTGGSYIIRYQPSTGKVRDVFYATTSGFGAYRFSSADTGGSDPVWDYAGTDNGDARRSYNGAVIGWYDGDAGALGGGITFEAPSIVVDNGDVLKVTVTSPQENVNAARNGGAALADKALQVRLHVTGLTSNTTMWFDLMGENGIYDQGLAHTTFVTVLDDITVRDGSFACVSSLRGDKATGNFIPGENLRLYAEVSSGAFLANIAYSPTVTVNSLFAKGSASLATAEQPASADSGASAQGMTGSSLLPQAAPAAGDAASTATAQFNATITSYRHLENLEFKVSNFDPRNLTSNSTVVNTVKATQTRNLVWSTGDANAPGFAENTGVTARGIFHGYDSATKQGGQSTFGDDGNDGRLYLPVSSNLPARYGLGGYLPEDDGVSGYALAYNGNGYEVSGAKACADANGNSGVFGTLRVAGTQLKNLLVRDFDMAAKDVAAARNGLEGEPAGSAGGLVGAVTFSAPEPDADLADAKNLVISACAAGAIVSAESGAAGGLVGSAAGDLTIRDSYASGHTLDGAYTDGPQESDDPHKDRYSCNVRSAQGAAGGLVGSVAGKLTAQWCYATCSVQGAPGAGTGGLVGTAGANSSIGSCYSTGLVSDGLEVDAHDMSITGAFAGELGADTTSTGNAYYSMVNPSMKVTGTSSPTQGDAAAFDKDTDAFQAFSGKGKAKPFDATLKHRYGGAYPLRTVAELHGSNFDRRFPALLRTHYGDWPSPDMIVVNTVSER